MKRTLVLALFTGLVGFVGLAQKTFTGTVVDESNVPLPGASVVIKGSNTGVATDFDGNFEIELSDGSEILLVSYVGYLTKEFDVANQSNATIQLVPDAQNLDEVVVTALGIEREKKRLGYSVQEVKNENLVTARETNVTNSLAGRVAGVQVTGGGSGVGSTSRIVIRGEGSLIPGNNSPLFVVDGIPITNRTISNRAEGNLETDYGNGAADINPDDIESISILKGPNATALYGSRGLNGVVLVTTKSGSRTQGLGISFTQNITFEDALRIPKYQNQYGQGAGGEFAFGDGFGGGINDNIDESWGPALNGQLIAQHDSPTTSGLRAGDFAVRPRNPDGTFADEIVATPWVANPGNIEDGFFETGRTLTTNLSLTGGNEQGNFRLSLTNLDNEGILPNTDFNRKTYALSGAYNLADWLRVSSSINYVNSSSNNRPNNSYGTENIMYLWVWFGRQINMDSLRDYWQPGLEGRQQFNYNYNWHDNPFFTMFENTNGFDKHRIFGNARADINLTKDLSLMVRTGIDYFSELRTGRRAYSTQRFARGQYREDDIFFKEQNTDFLLTYNKEIDGDFTIGASLGGNIRKEENRYKRISANSLSVPGIYNFQNAAEPLAKTQFNDERKINSLYAFANLSYKNMLFLDVTGRNDWSSTLPADNNSYFYPSVGLSAILSDMFQLPQAFTFLKLRGGWARVGNDTDPYALRNTFGFNEPFGNFQRVSASSVLRNENLKPEEANSIEVGADIRFFGNRLGLDITYYNSITRNQILTLPVANTSGFNSRIINAGEIQNQGIEIVLNANPIRTDNFSWDTSMNFTSARGEVKELTDGINTYEMSNNYLSVQARVGGRMGDVYGTGLVTVDDPDSEFFGQVVHDENGFSLRDPNLKKLGNYNPDFTLGWQNNFSYKNFNLGFLFDWRQGGVIMSRTVLIGGTSGLMDFTAVGRETGIVSEGVIQNADGSYRPNDVTLSGRDYYWWRYNRGNEEIGMFDASFLKLREVKLGYSFPQNLLKDTFIRSLNIALVGRNLALWTENPHFDPETISFNGGTIVPGVEDMALPSSRSYGFNINVTF
ncbi:SusC/RagA family TonB-linked outer membrane protein [Muricauda sp. SCSIO 64092]|uniref:SusC/RagA family TonB-linked outer membrane protein n=1 Tax=Allomuricauda sp. SCSIO 64092 TaxID=2908842 RepID=UPI001FF6896F|nr:SusC/RagA family TonB-linked outer membrane protein [Muricauda sp. SCSIO 64092]UOY07195.1 SusC/RagA family TonB-linked outer membrane protein [Muricauda sp. SCSIO 64092]